MAAILQAVLFFFTLGFVYATTSLDLVSFHENTCQYDKHFFPRRYNLSENCTWLSCDAKNQRVTIDQCEGPIRVGSEHPPRDFPDCCWPKYDRGHMYFGHTTRIHHAGNFKVVTETVKRAYPGDLTGKELCNASLQHFCPEGHVAQSCCGVTYNKTKNTTEVQWCPFLDYSNDPKGALVSSGKPHTQYPDCCPEYLHGPATSYCPCTDSGNQYQEYRRPCSYKRCKDEQDEECIPRADMEKKGCKVQLEDCHLKSTDQRCPKMICPSITEEVVENNDHQEYVHGKSEYVNVGKNDCTYKTIKFSGTLNGSEPCELWTCDLVKKQVLITKCSNETLPEHCKWTEEKKENMFPYCCPRKICEKEYTRLS